MSVVDDKLPDLRGKVIAVYFMSKPDMREGAIIEDATFERQGGRLFLVGRVPAGINPGDWNAGLMTYIAWDCVAEYTVLASSEEFRQRTARIPSAGSIH